jgi:hypothetical protein
VFAFLVAARFADPIVSLPPYQFARDRWACVRLQSIIRPELRHIRGNRSGPSVCVANYSRRELNGIFVRDNPGWDSLKGVLFAEPPKIPNTLLHYIHPVNLKEFRRVCQLKLPLLGMYSLAYQKVQSSLGSMEMLL